MVRFSLIAGLASLLVLTSAGPLITRDTCGDVVCAKGTECCNPFLSICIKPGAPCPRKRSPEPQTTTCGQNPPCRRGTTCCDTDRGICCVESTKTIKRNVDNSCGDNTCTVGQYCCNPVQGICANPGDFCIQGGEQMENAAVATSSANETSAAPVEDLAAVTCGSKVCPLGQRCCNPLTSTCTPPGQFCTQGSAETESVKTTEKKTPCGSNTCFGDQVCCNQLRGICTEPGGVCIFSDEKAATADTVTCGNASCQAGEYCCNPVQSICAPEGFSCIQG